MPQPPDPQLSLFPESPAAETPAPGKNTTDDVARATWRSDDEIAWERQRHHRSKKVTVNAMPAEGPACGRCRFWNAPSDKESFGTCRKRVVAQGRYPGYVEDRQVLEYDSIQDLFFVSPGLPLPIRVDYEHMRCKPGFFCSSYVAAEGKVAA